MRWTRLITAAGRPIKKSKMSIIFDALKKAEKKFDKQQSTSENTAFDNNSPNLFRKHKAVLIAFIPSLVAFTGLYFLLNNPAAPGPSRTRTDLPSAKDVRPVSKEVTLPQTPQSSRPNLTLNGVFFADDGTGYALINNSLLKEGDPIEGFYVKSITQDSATLKSDSSEFTIYYR